MKSVIEIEDENQRSQIEQELRMFEKVFASIHVFEDLILELIIVPQNFGEQVNKLRNTSDYKPARGTFTAMATTVQTENKITIVLSQELFDQQYDIRVRIFVVIHELMHIWNKSRFSWPADEQNTRSYYLHQLYVLYDEYVADRMAFSITDGIRQLKSGQDLFAK